MKLRKIKAIIAASSILLMVPVTTVSAAETTSNATVFFSENTSVTPPVNPLDPELPGTGPGTGMAGPLSIDYISTLDFGLDKVVSSTEELYNTTLQVPYLQVTDLRGTGAGWNVTAVCSSFTQNGDDTLRGAEISLSNAGVINVNSNITAPTPNQSVLLKTDGTTTAAIVSADSGAGQGTWVNRWHKEGQSENTNVQLKVPAGSAAVGNHTAVITWTLTDAPI